MSRSALGKSIGQRNAHLPTLGFLKMLILILLLLQVNLIDGRRANRGGMNHIDQPEDGMVLSGTKSKALYLYKSGLKSIFPDFHTFTSMGFNLSSINVLPEEKLHSIPMGNSIKRIEAPPVFRADDYMFHAHCDDPRRLVNDLSIVSNNGDLARFQLLKNKVQKTKKLEILALGGSITAGGYFEGFKKLLVEEEKLDVVVHNHGHGATELTYTIFCIEIDKYNPDIILIDFSVNDYGHPKLMDALIRKSLMLGVDRGGKMPYVVLVNLWVEKYCPFPRYLMHSQYYNIPLINVCPAVNLCYGKERLPRWRTNEYSTTDGVHPWGAKGVPFLGQILYGWWKRSFEVFDMLGNDGGGGGIGDIARNLPSPLYGKHVGQCTRCDALASDADGMLEPTSVKGFEIKTRMKIGFGGFNPNDASDAGGATKSFRRSWQAEKVGDSISFKFYGSSVKVAMWQRRDGMGILEAMIDNNPSLKTEASGFFKGFTWAMERNNTGRSEVMPLFEGLEDKEHLITFTVSEKPANVWVKGHTCQIFALLSASDDAKCKERYKRGGETNI